MSKWSDELRRLVARSTLTHQDLATRSGIPLRTLEQYLYGTRTPNLRQLRNLLPAFGADLDVFQTHKVPVLNFRGMRLPHPTPTTDPVVDMMMDVMRELNVSTKEMHRRTGCSMEALRMWMNGTHSPSVIAIDRCLAALGYEMRIVE